MSCFAVLSKMSATKYGLESRRMTGRIDVHFRKPPFGMAGI